MEKKERKVDKRIIRTKAAIRNAFLKLLAEKDFNKITIKEIADEADIDRKTIYNYYSGVDEIFRDLEIELIKGFEEAIGDFQFETIEDTLAAFAALSLFLQENMTVYTHIMKMNIRSLLLSEVVLYLKKKIRSVIGKLKVDPFKIELAVECVTAGMFAGYRYWFNSNREKSLDEFTAEMSALILRDLPTYLLSK